MSIWSTLIKCREFISSASLFFLSSFSHTLQPDCSFFSPHSSQPLPLNTHSVKLTVPLFLLKKQRSRCLRDNHPPNMAYQVIIRLGINSHFRVGLNNLVKGSPKRQKNQRQPPLLLLGVAQEHQAIQP